MDVADLNEIYDDAFDAIQEAGARRGVEFEAPLIFEELFMNVKTHAYGKGSGPVIINAHEEERGIVITVADCGCEFNIIEYKPKDLKPVGGRGIITISAFSKEMSYQRFGGLNINSVVV